MFECLKKTSSHRAGSVWDPFWTWLAQEFSASLNPTSTIVLPDLSVCPCRTGLSASQDGRCEAARLLYLSAPGDRNTSASCSLC